MFEHATWWELILRGVAIYVVVLLLLRLTGKRQVGQFTPFDLTVLLLVSEAVSTALNVSEKSILAAVILVATLLGLNAATGWVASRSRRVESIIEGKARFLIRNGRVDYKTLRKESISHRELLVALRREKCFTPHQAEYAILEPSGSISVRKRGG
jgi:uncharacterized membrane protein YcaP (DUF421 family)